MARPSQEQYEIVITGADAWNKWRERNPDVAISLSGAPLGGMNLDGVNFTEADLREADFGGASLVNSHFDSANLSGSNLNGADLTLSNLRAANLTGAYVMGTQFIHTRLNDATFVDAMMDGTVFADVDLTQVSGLEHVNHHGPCLVGLASLRLRSRGCSKASARESVRSEVEMTGDD